MFGIPLALCLSLLSESCAVGSTICPLCPAIGARTIAEEMQESDVVLVGRVLETKATIEEAEGSEEQDGENDSQQDFVRFRVEQVLVGEAHYKVGQQLKVPRPYGNEEDDLPEVVLVTAVDPVNPAWNTPIRLTAAARKYVGKIFALESDPVDRLVFYQQFLESPDEVIATDAYDEFARAPYEDVQAMRDAMDHDKVVQWIQSDEVPSSRRRLFFMMLGICGTTSDLPLLEKMLFTEKDPDEIAEPVSGIDATIACYLTLAGTDGLPKIKKRFFANPDAEYSEIYSALMAIRFHGTEGGVFETDELLPLLRCLLDRPQLADLVIPDLARWEDWSVLPRLIEIFKDADGKLSWLRVPIFNYLKVCPLPEAAVALEELKEIDPDAFRRSNLLFPLGDGDDENENIESGEPVDS